MLYKSQGRYGKAEPLLQQALTIRQHRLGGDHPDTATSLNNLGVLYNSQGCDGEAELFLQQALEICEKRLGPDHLQTVKIRDNRDRAYRPSASP